MMDDRMKRAVYLAARHAKLSHAMQSGVKWDQEHGGRDTEPKHLRVGVNVALRDHASLVGLLIEKGVMTEEEYLAAIVQGMEEEVKAYEERISKQSGVRVTLA